MPRAWSCPAIFEFGFNYVGPIGHDLDSLIPTLENLRNLKGAQFLRRHQEGLRLQARRGRPGELSRPRQVRSVGIVKPATPPKQTFTQVSATGCATWRRPIRAWSASRRRCARARAWSSSASSGITMSASPSSMRSRSRRAGGGLKPVVAIYSTFLQRAYDQLIHDVAIQNLPVVFALDRAGLVAPTARRMPARTTSPACAASRT